MKTEKRNSEFGKYPTVGKTEGERRRGGAYHLSLFSLFPLFLSFPLSQLKGVFIIKRLTTSATYILTTLSYLVSGYLMGLIVSAENFNLFLFIGVSILYVFGTTWADFKVEEKARNIY